MINKHILFTLLLIAQSFVRSAASCRRGGSLEGALPSLSVVTALYMQTVPVSASWTSDFLSEVHTINDRPIRNIKQVINKMASENLEMNGNAERNGEPEVRQRWRTTKPIFQYCLVTTNILIRLRQGYIPAVYQRVVGCVGSVWLCFPSLLYPLRHP